ncbi:type II secretion system protein [Marinomonas primoryensis]|jgi:type II secretory pathway pseudopilin PulG|uniref:type II secretion system protein n=1 Tax=Marinomonas primoryensis TaxID=178399 RepID=UPI003704A469
MSRRTQMKGSLLIEMLVACALISLFLPFLVSALARLQERHLLAQTYQDQHEIKAAIDAHFQAQWTRLVPANCAMDESLFLTIQSGESPPIRLASRKVSSGSDWIKGTDYGLCRGAVTVSSNPFETNLLCHWKVGDRTNFSSCESFFSGQVVSVSSHKSKIELTDDLAIGQSGMIESQDGFYWYLSPGKEGGGAFWRTPEESGNSLELLNGIERLSIFPLLDEDDNGLVDSLDTRYGPFALNKLRGLWVEYQYRLSNCKSDRQESFTQEYHSMRGDDWHYLPPCQGVGNQIIVLKGM